MHAEQKLLDNFARHGGPKLQQSSQAREPIAPEPGEWLLFAEAPHLHSYDPEYPSISIDEPIGYARRFGLKVAALIHDLLPLTHQNGRARRRIFVDMAAGAAVDRTAVNWSVCDSPSTRTRWRCATSCCPSRGPPETF